MSIPYEATGRQAQKARTRAALVAAARELLGDGITPTVEQVADAAGIGRATAYRYFPNADALLVATYPELGETSLLGDVPPDDPQERVAMVARSLTRQALGHETELRAMLRLSLEPDAPELPLRSGRRVRWVEDALEPLRDELGAADFRRLVLAVGAAVGIEALVWLTDRGGLSRRQAAATMEWSAAALVRAAIDQTRSGSRDGSRAGRRTGHS